MGTLFFFHSPIPRFSLPSMPKPIALPPLSCLRNNGDVNKIVDMPQSMYDDNQNVKQDNIWQLSKEAQQKKQSLLSKIKKLEAEKQAGAGNDNLSTCSELLLRIDTMVLSSMISAGEASELRSLVMNYKVSPPDVFNIISHKKDPELLGELRRFSDGHKNNGFYTVHICTEMTPLVPRGSVASYVTGISRALHRKGHLVELILPKYASLNLDGVQGLHEVNVEVTSYFNGQLHGNRIWTGVVFGIGVTLIEPKYYSSFFSREMIYGYPDDFERFSYFCRASLDYIVKCGKQPDVLHLHNWGTAIVGPLFRDTVELSIRIELGKLVIAPYGLDKSTWDPLTDYFLPENFNAENMNGKAVCKAALLQQLGLSEHSSAILVGCIFSEGRDLDEKRVEEVILNAKQHDVQFIFMGASKRSVLNQAPESLQKEFKDDNLKFVPTYDEALLHLVFAGSDIILCQSFLDPTDEIPLIALRYGAAPLALVPDASSNRSIPFDRSFINQDHEATKYSKLINSSFVNMFISLAIDEIRTNPAMWKRKIMQAMAHDLSWDGECYDVHVEAYSTIKNM
ncbi:putative starch synthase 4, chloroplastic/amyloplastic [Glycine soja]|nr:putative starch synthase 4, chloroplastic/amyloplastic [Glycine max]